jgi:polyisoprenoid-binding protein YceI
MRHHRSCARINRLLLSVVLLFIAGGTLQAQSAFTRSEASSTYDASTFRAVPKVKGGRVEWRASKVVGEHNGIVKVARGQFTTRKGQISGGKFIVDMNTIEVQDLQGQSRKKLEAHLAGRDFFHVEQHPSATFALEQVQPIRSEQVAFTHRVTGQLTIRGHTHPIDFMANIEANGDGTYSATSEQFQINRKRYGIEYQVPADKWTKGAFIEDEIKLTIQVRAARTSD